MSTRAVEIGVGGFVAKSTAKHPLDFGYRIWLLKGALKELSEDAEKVSQCVVALTDYLGT